MVEDGCERSVCGCDGNPIISIDLKAKKGVSGQMLAVTSRD